ncbi:MAG: MAPEG family protein [Bradyrhizobium sp.]|nr:MAG: MAPEG family protein [Bradyrhizobium sp.]
MSARLERSTISSPMSRASDREGASARSRSCKDRMMPGFVAGPAPAFAAYAATALVLSLNLLILWVSSGGVRAHSGVAINPEDGLRFGVRVAEVDPPVVARYLRAHRNAEAMIYPFLLLGMIYVLAGGGAGVAIPIFSVFAVARIAHSIVYLRAMQPWRTIAFASSVLALLALMVAVIVVLLMRATASG